MSILEEASIITDNTFIPEDDTVIGDIDQDLSEIKKPGKKKNEVWNYFTEDTRKKGYSPSICKFCGDAKARGRPSEMMAHLALQCDSVEASVKEKYLKILAEANQTI